MELEFYSYRTSKHKLLQRVRPMSRSAFAHLINPIIAKSRRMSIEEAKQRQYLQSNEVVYFLNKIGESLKEYQFLIRMNTAQMNKSIFKRRFTTISDPEFSRIANSIISKERNIDFRQSARQRYLLPKEVIKILDEIGELWNEQVAV